MGCAGQEGVALNKVLFMFGVNGLSASYGLATCSLQVPQRKVISSSDR